MTKVPKHGRQEERRCVVADVSKIEGNLFLHVHYIPKLPCEAVVTKEMKKMKSTTIQMCIDPVVATHLIHKEFRADRHIAATKM